MKLAWIQTMIMTKTQKGYLGTRRLGDKVRHILTKCRQT
jgi:hypothetical protein